MESRRGATPSKTMNNPRPTCIMMDRTTQSLRCGGCASEIEIPRCVAEDPDQMLDFKEFFEEEHLKKGCHQHIAARRLMEMPLRRMAHA